MMIKNEIKNARIANTLIESFGYNPITETDLVNPAMTKGATSGIGAKLSKIANAIKSPLTGVVAAWQAFDQIKDLPTDMPKEQYRSAVAKIITKVVAEVGLFTAGSTIGAAIGAAAGPLGAAVAGLAGGVAAGYVFDGNVHELVDMAVDYYYPSGATATSTTTTKPTTTNPASVSGDEPLRALQRIIGTKPDNIYGPDTYEKLKIWQRQHGLTVDGQPGKNTYAAAGISVPAPTTVAEDIASLRDRLAMIELSEISEGLVDTLFKAGKNAVKGAGKTIMPAAEKAIEKLSPGQQEFSDAVKRLGVKNIDGKLFAKDPKAIGKWTEVKKVGDDYIRPKGAAGFNDAVWHASGPLVKQLNKLEQLPPAQLANITDTLLANPALAAADRAAIKQSGLLAWIRANPKAIAAGGILSAIPIVSNLIHNNGGTPNASMSQTSGTKHGEYDPEVAKIQQELVKRGYPLKVDGIMGPQTKKAQEWELSSSKISTGLDQVIKDTTPKPAVSQPVSAPGDITQSFMNKYQEHAVAESMRILQNKLSLINN